MFLHWSWLLVTDNMKRCYLSEYSKELNLNISVFKVEHWKIIVRSQSVHGPFEAVGLLTSIHHLPWEVIRIHSQIMISGLAMKIASVNKMGAKVNDRQIISVCIDQILFSLPCQPGTSR